MLIFLLIKFDNSRESEFQVEISRWIFIQVETWRIAQVVCGCSQISPRLHGSRRRYFSTFNLNSTWRKTRCNSSCHKIRLFVLYFFESRKGWLPLPVLSTWIQLEKPISPLLTSHNSTWKFLIPRMCAAITADEGQLQNALSILNDGIKANPYEPDTISTRADIHAAMGNFQLENLLEIYLKNHCEKPTWKSDWEILVIVLVSQILFLGDELLNLKLNSSWKYLDTWQVNMTWHSQTWRYVFYMLQI